MDDRVDVPNGPSRQPGGAMISDLLRSSTSDQRGNGVLRELALTGELRAECLGDLVVAVSARA